MIPSCFSPAGAFARQEAAPRAAHSLRFGAAQAPSNLLLDLDKLATYRQFYVQQIQNLSPNGQHALKELDHAARNHGGAVMRHAFVAQVLAGKYPEIKKFVMSEHSSLMFVMRADDKAATTAYIKRVAFQQALETVFASPLPPAPDYVKVADIPEAEAQRYLQEYGRNFEPQFTRILNQFPDIVRNFWGRVIPPRSPE